MAGETIDRRCESILRGLEGFYDSNGLRLDRSNIDPDLVRIYLLRSTLASSTKATYLWALCSAFGLDRGVGPSFLGSKGATPYTLEERSELLSIARAQKKQWRRSSALVILAASIGAGARSEELRHITSEDLDPENSKVKVGARLVPIKSPWREILFQGGQERVGYLFHPGAPRRDSKNFVNDFASKVVRDPDSPRLQISRARSSFICDRWNEGLPLVELAEMAGIYHLDSFIRYAHLMDTIPRTKAGLRRLRENESH